MVSAFGKKEKDPMNGKTYWEEEEDLEAERKKIQAKKAAEILARDKKRDAMTKAAEAKYDTMWSHAFAQHHEQLEEHLKHRMKVATSDAHKAKEAARAKLEAKPKAKPTPLIAKHPKTGHEHRLRPRHGRRAPQLLIKVQQSCR